MTNTAYLVGMRSRRKIVKKYVESLPWWAMEFGKLSHRIWKNLPRKTVVPKDE